MIFLSCLLLAVGLSTFVWTLSDIVHAGEKLLINPEIFFCAFYFLVFFFGGFGVGHF